MEEEKLMKINKELKVCINEASFISMKCRNKVLKIFSDEFSVDLDISNYKNVDLEIKDDFTILYRDDVYSSSNKITNYEELEERYLSFKKRADELIKKKDINFQNKSNWNNISNLIVIICLLFIMIAIVLFMIHSFLLGDYYNFLWVIVFIIPIVVPRLKESLFSRIQQAKKYLKSLLKK